MSVRPSVCNQKTQKYRKKVHNMYKKMSVVKNRHDFLAKSKKKYITHIAKPLSSNATNKLHRLIPTTSIAISD